MHRHADHHTRIALFALVLAALLATLSVTAVGATNFSVTVTTTVDSSNACATSGMDACSLRDAIAFANTHFDPADLTTITLPGSLTPYALTNGRVGVASNVTINGAGASATVINGSSSDRIFTTGLGVGLGRGESATFNNLTLSNGHDTFGGAPSPTSGRLC